MAERYASAFRIHPLAGYRPERRVAAKLLATVIGGLPCLERAQDLRRKRLVDFVDVEILERDAGAIEHRRHRIGRRHQEAFARPGHAHIIDRGDGGMGEKSLDRRAARVRPCLAGEQHAGGAVGQRCAVARGQGSGFAPVVHGFQRREFFEAGVGTQIVVPAQARHWDDQVVVKAFLPRLGTLEVTLQSELILRHAADAPFLGHKLAVLAHRQAGAGLAHRGHGRLEIAWPQSQPGLQSLTERTAAGAFEHDLVEGRAVDDGNVAGGIDAAGDRNVDFSPRDALSELNGGRQAGAARALDIVGGSMRVQAGTERRFAGEIPVTRMLDHCAGGDFAERLALESEFVDQRAQARGQHLEITERAVGAVAARKRDPDAADDGHATQVIRHGSLSRPGR